MGRHSEGHGGLCPGMNFSFQHAVGIDMGDGTLKAVELVRRGRRVKLLRYWRVPYYMQQDPESSLEEALRKISSQIGSRTRVIVGDVAGIVRSHTYRVPTMEDRRTAELIRYEVVRDTGVAAEDLLIAHKARKGVEEQPVLSVSMTKADARKRETELRSAGVSWDDLEASAVAMSSFVEFEMPWGGDRIILGVGETSTELVLLTNLGLWTRQLPFGLADNSDIEVLAERLKGEVDSACSFLLPGDRTFDPKDLVLTEEGSLEAPLTRALKSAFGIDVVRMSKFDRVITNRELDRAQQRQHETLAMSKAFGLALSGLQLGRFRCPIITKNSHRESHRRLPAIAATVFLSAAGIVAATENARHQVKTFNGTLPIHLEGEMQDLAVLWGNTLNELKVQETRAHTLRSLAERRKSTSVVRKALVILAPLIKDRGEAALHLDNLWYTPSQPSRPGNLRLTLFVDPSFDSELEKRLHDLYSPLFESVRVRGPEPAPEAGRSRFVVEISLP